MAFFAESQLHTQCTASYSCTCAELETLLGWTYHRWEPPETPDDHTAEQMVLLGCCRSVTAANRTHVTATGAALFTSAGAVVLSTGYAKMSGGTLNTWRSGDDGRPVTERLQVRF
jgi:hypothetical protein